MNIEAEKVDSKLAADLSKEAMKSRDRRKRLEKVADWARSMNRTFKGISGYSRRDYIHLGIMSDPVLRAEVEAGRDPVEEYTSVVAAS